MDDAAALRADPLVYTPSYCEENVANLARRLHQTASPLPPPAETGSSSSSPQPSAVVAFVSNDSKRCPVWHQRAANEDGAPVVWDYHVVLLIRRGEGRWVVMDLDSTLPFPCPLRDYAVHSFRPHHPAMAGDGGAAFHQRFRVLPSELYLRVFASDRRHMRTDAGGWLAPPPLYPPPRGPDAGDAKWNLGALWDVREGSGGWGRTLSLAQLLAEFGGAP
jgi:hypothetical protein